MKENSIEEAIERLEYIDRTYSCNNYYSIWDLKCIEILLSDYKRVLKENEELRADNYELNNRISDLLENIPIQKVKDKIKELDERIKNPERNSYWASYTVSECIGIRRILQDLLERSREDE